MSLVGRAGGRGGHLSGGGGRVPGQVDGGGSGGDVGVAMEVPEIVMVPWSAVVQSEVMSQARRVQVHDLAEVGVRLGVVLGAGGDGRASAHAGRRSLPPASADSFPAATAKVTPEAMAFATASSGAGSAPPPGLLATEGPWWFLVT